MTAYQYAVVLFCVFINVADGFDALTIGFVAPALSREWHIAPSVLGVVFSAASFGMMLGALILAPLADRLGRRRIIIVAAGIIAVSMFGTAASSTVSELAALRFLTGVGIGTLVPSLNVYVSEYSNEKQGNFFLSILHVGFAIGAIVCSAVSIFLVQSFGWRSVFFTAGFLGAVIFLVALFALPESLDYLLTRQPPNALHRANTLLQRLGEAPLRTLPPRPTVYGRQKVTATTFLTPLLLLPTLLLLLSAFAHYFVSYFQSNWTPKILADAGLSDSAAISSGVVIGVGAAAGNILMGIFSRRFGAYRLTLCAFFCGAIALCIFGLLDAHPALLLGAAGLCGFFVQASFTGTMIASTRFFPAAIRGTGVGLVVGLGRAGGISGPIVAGFLIGLGWERLHYFPVFAGTFLLGAVGMFMLGRLARRHGADAVPER